MQRIFLLKYLTHCKLAVNSVFTLIILFGFLVQVNYKDTLEFVMESRDKAKSFWKLTAATHTFFRQVFTVLDSANHIVCNFFLYSTQVSDYS